jgi:hypothetical protein
MPRFGTAVQGIAPVVRHHRPTWKKEERWEAKSPCNACRQRTSYIPCRCVVTTDNQFYPKHCSSDNNYAPTSCRHRYEGVHRRVRVVAAAPRVFVVRPTCGSISFLKEVGQRRTPSSETSRVGSRRHTALQSTSFLTRNFFGG